MAITKKLIDGLIVTIQNLYLTDDIPWMIGYSGGKDSTAAVQLVWTAIEQLPERYRKKTEIRTHPHVFCMTFYKNLQEQQKIWNT